MPGRPLRIGPPLRGLTDLPSVSEPEHATQALNVEFTNAAVETRQGSARRAGDFLAADMRPRLMRFAEHDGFNGYTFVGLTELSGGDKENQNAMMSFGTTANGAGGVIPGGNIRESQVAAANLANRHLPIGTRWDMCAFRSYLDNKPRYILCAERATGGTVYWSADNQNAANQWNDFNILTPINREPRLGTPYHGGAAGSSRDSDDAGHREDSWITNVLRARYCRPHQHRLWLGKIGAVAGLDIPDPQSHIWCSNSLDPEGWAKENIVAPAGSDHTAVTGLGNYKDELLVFRRNSISRMNHSGKSAVFHFREVVHGRGCVAHDTITEGVRGGVVFLAEDGVYAFTGSGELQYLSKRIEQSLRRILVRPEIRGAWSCHYPKRRQVWFGLPEGEGASVPDAVWVMDYSTHEPSWSRFVWSESDATRILVGGAATDFDGNRIFVAMGRSDSTWDYVEADLDNTIQDDSNVSGSEIDYPSTYETGPIAWENNQFNRWRFIRPLFRPTGSHNITCTWRMDSVAADAARSNTFSADGDGTGLGSFVLGTSRLGDNEDHSTRVDVHGGGDGRYGRVGVSLTANRFHLLGFEIDSIARQVRR